MRRYLKAAYCVYWTWDQQGGFERGVRIAASISKFRPRRGARPMSVLVDLTCAEPDIKVRSRWAAALRAVVCYGIEPREFRSFLKDHGGIARMARAVARHRGESKEFDDDEDEVDDLE
jgi:hypothetical protein